MNSTLTPGCRVVIEGTTFTFCNTEKRGRWEYAIVKDTKGKKHEYTVSKIESILPAATPTQATNEATKENTMNQTATEKPVKEPKEPKEPKAPRVKKDISNDPMALGFQKFRDAHPAKAVEALGRKVQDKGDEVADILLRELSENNDDIFKCPTVIKHLPVAELQAKYANLNKGMQRMNIGNRLRGILTPSADKQAREIEKAEAKAKREAERNAKVAEKEAAKAEKVAEREAKAAAAKAEKEAKAAK